MSSRFAGKHVVVTGGGRGIGFEIARQFGQEGARLTIFDYAKDFSVTFFALWRWAILIKKIICFSCSF